MSLSLHHSIACGNWRRATQNNEIRSVCQGRPALPAFVLRPELAAALGLDRFLREIPMAAQLNHPHILPLLNSGSADGLLYDVMPFVEGETLRQRVTREGQLPLEDAVRRAREPGCLRARTCHLRYR